MRRRVEASSAEIVRLVVAVVPALVEVQVWGIDGMWRRWPSHRLGQRVVCFVVLVVGAATQVATGWVRFHLPPPPMALHWLRGLSARSAAGAIAALASTAPQAQSAPIGAVREFGSRTGVTGAMWGSRKLLGRHQQARAPVTLGQILECLEFPCLPTELLKR